MKFNWRYNTLFCGISIDSINHLEKKRKEIMHGKVLMTKIESIHNGFTPSFSLHALERISERLQKPRVLDACLQVGPYVVTGPFEARWIDPKLLLHIIEDIKGNIGKFSYISDKTNKIAVRGKLAYYIISKNMEVVTVLPDEYANGGWYKRYNYHLASIDYVFRFFKIEQGYKNK